MNIKYVFSIRSANKFWIRAYNFQKWGARRWPFSKRWHKNTCFTFNWIGQRASKRARAFEQACVEKHVIAYGSVLLMAREKKKKPNARKESEPVLAILQCMNAMPTQIQPTNPIRLKWKRLRWMRTQLRLGDAVHAMHHVAAMQLWPRIFHGFIYNAPPR